MFRDFPIAVGRRAVATGIFRVSVNARPVRHPVVSWEKPTDIMKFLDRICVMVSQLIVNARASRIENRMSDDMIDKITHVFIIYCCIRSWFYTEYLLEY